MKEDIDDRGSGELARGRPEAAAAIWRWEEGSDDRDRRAAAARRAGIVRGLLAALGGALLWWVGRPVVASVAWSLGGLTLALALVSPLGGYGALERAVAKIAELVGAALTWTLLAPVFYLFFAPFGLLRRRGRRDPLKRRLEPDADTYWTEREQRPLDRPY